MSEKRYRVVSVSENGYQFTIVAVATATRAYRVSNRLQMAAMESSSSVRFIVEEIAS